MNNYVISNIYDNADVINREEQFAGKLSFLNDCFFFCLIWQNIATNTNLEYLFCRYIELVQNNH